MASVLSAYLATPTMSEATGTIDNTDMIHVRRARRVGAYRLKLWFTDGTAGGWDFSELRDRPGEMTAPFKDPSYFDRVFIEYGALTWPNGYDWAPEALHDDMLRAGALRFEALSAEDVA